MKSTFEVTSKVSGKLFRFEAEYVCKMVDRYLDADGWKVKASEQEESTVGSMLTVYVDGKKYDSCSHPSLWGLFEVKGKSMKVRGLKIGLADPDDAKRYEEWIASVIEAGTEPEVIVHREAKRKEKEERERTRAKRIVEEAEKQKDIPDYKEARRREKVFNDINNQGGYGYVPHIIDRQEYEAALKILGR